MSSLVPWNKFAHWPVIKRNPSEKENCQVSHQPPSFLSSFLSFFCFFHYCVPLDLITQPLITQRSALSYTISRAFCHLLTAAFSSQQERLRKVPFRHRWVIYEVVNKRIQSLFFPTKGKELHCSLPANVIMTPLEDSYQHCSFVCVYVHVCV